MLCRSLQLKLNTWEKRVFYKQSWTLLHKMDPCLNILYDGTFTICPVLAKHHIYLDVYLIVLSAVLLLPSWTCCTALASPLKAFVRSQSGYPPRVRSM